MTKLPFEGRITDIIGLHIHLKPTQPLHYSGLKDVFNCKTTMKELIPLFEISEWTNEHITNRYSIFEKEYFEEKTISYTVIENETGVIIGNCGFKNISLSHSVAEFGIILHQSAWGKAFSEECHLMCLQLAFEILKVNKVFFRTTPKNIRMKEFFNKHNIHAISSKDEHFCRHEVSLLSWPNTKNSLKKRIERSRHDT